MMNPESLTLIRMAWELELNVSLGLMNHIDEEEWQLLKASLIISLLCSVMAWIMLLCLEVSTISGGNSSMAAMNILEKIQLIHTAIHQLLFSTDKKFKARSPLSEADIAKLDTAAMLVRRIVFIRHGESEWNEVFNRGFGTGFLPRLVRALKREMDLLPTTDSLFFDSSISQTGLEQATNMASKLQNIDHELVNMLLHGSCNSIIACSTLRRSIQTAMIGLRRRLETTGERIYIMTALQEVTLNVDGITLGHAGQSPNLVPLGSDLDTYMPNNFDPVKSMDHSMNFGNTPSISDGLKRIHQFLRWAFEQFSMSTLQGTPNPSIIPTIVIAGGHSLYLLYMFKLLLPYDLDFVGKTKKLSNCGVVSFNVYRNPANNMYHIDPESIGVISGSWM